MELLGLTEDELCADARGRPADAAVWAARAPQRATDPARPARPRRPSARGRRARGVGEVAGAGGTADRRARATRLRGVRGRARPIWPSAASCCEAAAEWAEPFSHQLRVRYAECDSQGVVFNAHYLAYFDISITELWRAAFGGYQVMIDRGVDVVVAEAQLRFLRLRAVRRCARRSRSSVTKLGNTSIVSQPPRSAATARCWSRARCAT